MRQCVLDKMSMDQVELLKSRGLLFYKYAGDALKAGHFDMAGFFAEQALQLRLKSILLRMLGYTPRTHGIRELISLILKLLSATGRDDLSQQLEEFSTAQKSLLRLLEEAYTGSRYSPKPYEREDAEKALRVVKEGFKLFDVIEVGVFGGQGPGSQVAG